MKLSQHVLYIICFFLLSPAAGAKKDPVYFIGAFTRDASLTGITQKIESTLTAELNQRGVKTLRPQNQPGSDKLIRVQDLSRLLDDARGQFFEGRFKDAVSRCDDGIARFEDQFAHRVNPEAWKYYAELSLVRVMALRRLDQKAQGDLAMAAIAAQVPEYIPDPNIVPPNLLNRYQAIKERLQSLPSIELTLQSNPPGAQAIVNGKNVGLTPIALKSLTPGPHYVTIKTETERFEEFVVLREGNRVFQVNLSSHLHAIGEDIRKQISIQMAENELAQKSQLIAKTTFLSFVEQESGVLRIYMAKMNEGRLASVLMMEIDNTLMSLESEVPILVARIVESSGDAIVGAPDRPATNLRSRFLNQSAPAADATGNNSKMATQSDQNKVVEAESEEGSLFFPALISSLVAGGVLTGLAGVAGASAGVWYYYMVPSNTEGTDVVIDASQL
jgi:hypothetical protein